MALTVNLSEEDKKKIEEQEKQKLDEQQYREEVRDNLNKAPTKKAGGRAWIFLLFIPIILVIFGFISNPSGNNSNTQKKADNNPTSQTNSKASEVQMKKEEEQRKQQLQELSTLFCSERSKPNIRAVNLGDFIAMYEANGETVTLRPANGVYPTAENCQKVVDICLKIWTKKECKNIAETKIWIGMEKDQLILSLGLPKDRNNSTYSFGVNSQWVYSNFGPYVYLEGKSENDMKVTSWQD